MYNLRTTLVGHDQDVRDAVSVDDHCVASVSRDGTLRIWRGKDENQSKWEDTILHDSGVFLNSVSIDPESGLVYCGAKSGLIEVFFVDGACSEPQWTLVGHTSNVCSLDFSNNTLISSSWDCTARVWRDMSPLYELSGHTAAIWDAKIWPTNNNKYITVSADRTVKIWEHNKLLKSFDEIHEDVIRHVDVFPNGERFVTCSNDGLIKVCDATSGEILNVLHGHESFVYSVKIIDSDRLVSCGEDRSVRIWSLATSSEIQVIRLPAISVWSVDVMGNRDLVVSSSDKMVRLFTEDDTRVASTSEVNKLKESVEKMALSSKSMGFDDSQLVPYETLNRPGEKNGKIICVKSPSGVIEAHQFSNGSWTKVGDVMGTSSIGNDKKVSFEGSLYDYVFDVDIEDGKPPLKLPVNVSDNAYDIADSFLARHDLPASYREQIVNFILANTVGMSLDDNQAQVIGSRDPEVREPVTQNFKVLPVKDYLSMSNYKADTIFGGIAKMNSSENGLSDKDLAVIGSALQDPASGYNELFHYATTIRREWNNKNAAYDIMRIIAPYLSQSDCIEEFIEEGLGNKDITISMLTVRLFINCFQNKHWGISLLSSPKVYENIFLTIDTLFPEATRKQSVNMALAVATLLLNYTVLTVNTNRTEMLPVLSDVINTKFGILEEYQDNEETAYRMAIAYGNLATLEPTLLSFANKVSWLINIKRVYGNIPRFSTLFVDLQIS